MRTSTQMLRMVGILFACASGVQAVTMDWVTVGDPGNLDDRLSSFYGGVAYTYNIGKYEVTNAQYCEFLNAVAAADPNNLYSTSMGSGFGGITRNGASPNYTYSVIPGRGNRPVNFVGWYDTLRFANWMHNGQQTGVEGLATTEDGAYDISLGASVVRKPGATVFLTSEDEWYKAAYYKGGGTNAGYWLYATQSNTAPTAEAPAGFDPANGSANYNSAIGDLIDVGQYTYKPSVSAYGTFDQGGNAYEWNEALVPGPTRCVRGGAFDSDVSEMSALFRGWPYPELVDLGTSSFGFRVASIPEPASILMLAFAGLASLRRRDK